MRSLSLLLFCVSAAWTQAPAVESTISPDTVVATVNGKKITAKEMQAMLSALPPQLQQNYANNRKEFLKQYMFMRYLADLAEKEHLAEQSPYKERLDYFRAQTLWQAQVDKMTNDVVVTPDDEKKFYESNLDRFTEAKIKVIYIPYTKSSGGTTKKTLTQSEAKAKAEKIVQQARSGADFVKLVKENSEDATSVAKDGDFGTVRRSDNMPEAIREGIFALKPGEVSNPIEQPNGYYIFRMEEKKVLPYSQVRETIYNELRQARFAENLQNLQKKMDVRIENEAFFSSAPGPGSGK
jgi:peptidyl-prolyl cis-trans isomerase C